MVRLMAVAVSASGCISLIATNAEADPPISDLSVQTLLKQSFQHDSNPLMVTSGARAVYGSVTSPELIVNSDTASAHADLDSRIDANKFDVKGFDSVDLHSTGHLTGGTQTWQSAMIATLDYDTTRTSEVAASGINVAGVRHTGLSLQPQETVSISQTDQMQMSGSYQRSLYKNLTQYTNYEVYGLSPTYQHGFDELNTGFLQVQAGRYQTISGASITIDNIGPTIGWTRHFSERLNGTASVGEQKMYFRYDPSLRQPDTTSTGKTYGLTLNFQGQQDTMQFGVNRQPSPNANGSESETTTFSLNETHMVTPRLELDLLSSYQSYDYSGGTPQSGVQTSYISLAPKLLYHLTQSLSSDVTYQYRRKEIATGQTAQSNAVMLNLTYKPVAESLAW